MMINITFQTICKYVTFQKIKKELNSKLTKVEVKIAVLTIIRFSEKREALRSDLKELK